MSSGQYAPLASSASHEDDDPNDMARKSSGRFFPVDDFDMDEDAKKPRRCAAKRTWLLIGCIGVVLVVSVSVGLVFTKRATYIFGQRSTRSERKLSFEEVLQEGKYSPQRFSCSWRSDSSYVKFNFSSGIQEITVDDQGKETYKTLVPQDLFFDDQFSTSHHEISPDGDWIMLTKNNKQLYRHSFYANYAAYHIKTSKLVPVYPPGGGDQLLRYVGWGSVGNALTVVFGNNIYYLPSVLDTKYQQITTDGVPIQIFNGVPDWVYEEEILASTHAIEFSPDGHFLAYVKFNSSQVPFYKFPKYGKVDDAYTTIDRIAYPKAGYSNPTVSIYVKNLKSTQPAVRLLPPDTVRYSDHYYSYMKWASNSMLYVNWLNRAQNYTESVIYGAINGARVTVESHSTKHGWINDDYPKPYFATDGSYYITMLPRQEHEAGRFRHIAKVSLKEKGTTFLTSGRWDVAGMSCFDYTNEILYFKSTETSPGQRHVYSLKIKTKEKKCITCDMPDKSECTYYYPQFSKKCTWVNLMCQGPEIPRTHLYNIKTGKYIQKEDNKELKARLEAKDLPYTVSYDIPSDGYNIPVKETRPHNFDKNKEYAVLFDVYGGPGTQKVAETFGLFFNEYLVSNFDIVVVTLDARGSGYHGENFMHAVYKRLGYYEARDTIAVGRYLQKQSYINPDKLCIWGWSYGGFLSSTVLATGSGVFKCSIAVAPVTDWRYYDTVYSERYMGMPTKGDNLIGYKETAVMPFVKNMTHSDFLLVHGTADDNVHFQNSAHLAFALIEAGVQFRTQFYTDKDHGIDGNGAQPHLYHLLTNFLESKLQLQSS